MGTHKHHSWRGDADGLALALGLFTGTVSQFVPTIGTHIAGIVPVVVLTLEPRISAKAMELNTAVSFLSVLAGQRSWGRSVRCSPCHSRPR